MRILTICFVSLCFVAMASARRATAVDEFVGIDAFPQVRTLLYTPSQFPTATVFVGEPIQFVVTVHNNTRRPVTIDTARLFDRVTIDVERKGQSRKEQLAVRGLSTPSIASPTLAPGRRVESTMSLTASGSGGALQPGVYVARIALPPVAIGRVSGNVNDSLSREVTFEIREHSTDLENWDYLLHRAYRAKLEGMNLEEQRLLEELLRRNPVSVPAFADLGQMWRRQRDCARARPLFQRAIELLTTGSDAELLIGQTGRQEWVGGLRGLMGTCY